jgi:hypothetical protein
MSFLILLEIVFGIWPFFGRLWQCFFALLQSGTDSASRRNIFNTVKSSYGWGGWGALDLNAAIICPKSGCSGLD